MNALKLFAIGAVVCLLAPPVRGEEKPDSDKDTVPTGAVIEFTKDGKFKATGKKGDVEMTVEGTYKVEKDTFITTMKIGDQVDTQTMTITKVSEKEMSIKDKDGKVVELKKVK
jgi:uncharacterized protein (TIGR03066 family)